MKRYFAMRTTVLCFAVFMTALIALAGKTTSVNVTTIVQDNASDGTPLLMRSDDHNGSGDATYAATSNGEWDLILYNQSIRTLWITPNDPVGSQPTGPPAGYYFQGVQSSSRCFDQNGNTVPLQNILTSSGYCKLGVNFESGGTLYKLLMSPFPFSASGDGTPTCPSTGCPATGAVTVTCNTVSSGQCVNWTIVPNTSMPNANVANLYRYSSKGKNATWVFIGQYYNTFSINVTNP